MRNTARGMVAIVLIALAAGCGGGGPESTVRSLMEARKKGEAGKEAGYACFTTKAREFFEAMEKRAGGQGKSMFSSEEEILEYEIKDTKVDGDTATVTVAERTRTEGKEKSEEAIVGLKKEDGSWKIYLVGDANGQMNLETQGPRMLQMMEGLEKQFGAEMSDEEESEDAPPADVQKAVEKMLEGLGKAAEGDEETPAIPPEKLKEALERMKNMPIPEADE